MYTNDTLQSLFASGNDSASQFGGNFRTPAKVKRKVIPKDSGSATRYNPGRAQQGFGGLTPKTPASARQSDHLGHGEVPLSAGPLSFATLAGSPITPTAARPSGISGPSPSAIKFADRLNKAKIEETLNPHIPMESAGEDETVPCEVSLVPGQQTGGYRYMYEKLMEKGDYLDERIHNFAEIIGEAVRDTLPEKDRDDFCMQHPGVPKQEPIFTVGRICSDTVAENAKLNEQSVVLESSRGIGSGCRVKMNVSDVPEYSLFPGQIIGVHGMNPSGHCIDASRLLLPPLPAKPASTPSQLAAYYPPGSAAAKRPINIFIANGPYTLDDSLNFEPLEELTAQIEKEKPEVVILQGPFVDAEHPMIAAGDIDEELDDLFKSRVAPRIERISQARGHHGTVQVILIPSTRDACSEWVSFPQPALAAALDERAALERRAALGIPARVLLFPNPVQFTINEVVFACCSTDVLWQMASEEPNSRHPPSQQQHQQRSDQPPIAPHKLARLFTHLLTQRTFYPLFPPPLNNASLDLSRHAALDLQAVPDVLIVASRLQYTARVVDGCVCVNPGWASKGRTGGTFARVCVWPLDMQRVEEAMEDVVVAHAVDERCRVEIRRI
ncbi:DNA polymerase alpha/epsilon subunit B-domain-containing protein [Fimicolochytrium jonesii]|uniref:DNA polymerase alpha/epsilon subunit B-domain-containing protein n=1 Tax=Fimicolochytrium jonesii TaxID=1396493 RepID=UPI0022FE414D|nr:DNA polymerase alpha/epsilon subunit B-domain-containing protein [Fimicolochytrium jonesii]KAI8825620.1 DNA polymerase alpha/epsilon subunit B-domain-containing protein [Fimicolochytrium jonesii]